MRKLLYLFIFIAGTAVAQDKQYIITGNVTGVPAGSVVFLANMQNPTDTAAKATVTVTKKLMPAKQGEKPRYQEKAQFILKGKLEEPALYYLNFTKPGKKQIFFLDNSNITISGDITNVQGLDIKGSRSHDDFISFQKIFDPAIGKYNALQQQAKATGMTDTLFKAINDQTVAIQAEVEGFVSQHRSSYVSAFLLLITSQLSTDIALLDKRYNMLEPNIQQSSFGKYVRQIIDESKIGAVGSQAIEFTQNDTTGTPITLASFRGKYVLIDFWASWCGPCRQENPNVVANYNKFRDKNFTVLGVSLDRAREPWIKAIKDDNLSWTHVSDLKFWNNDVAAKYHIQQIPQNLLIDPEGKIIAKNLRGGVLQAKLCEVLGCN